MQTPETGFFRSEGQKTFKTDFSDFSISSNPLNIGRVSGGQLNLVLAGVGFASAGKSRCPGSGSSNDDTKKITQQTIPDIVKNLPPTPPKSVKSNPAWRNHLFRWQCKLIKCREDIWDKTRTVKMGRGGGSWRKEFMKFENVDIEAHLDCDVPILILNFSQNVYAALPDIDKTMMLRNAVFCLETIRKLGIECDLSTLTHTQAPHSATPTKGTSLEGAPPQKASNEMGSAWIDLSHGYPEFEMKDAEELKDGYGLVKAITDCPKNIAGLFAVTTKLVEATVNNTVQLTQIIKSAENQTVAKPEGSTKKIKKPEVDSDGLYA
jgi:hypothetical protein